MQITVKEGLEIARVVIAASLFIFGGYMSMELMHGWAWYLVAGLLVYPSNINIDFRHDDS